VVYCVFFWQDHTLQPEIRALHAGRLEPEQVNNGMTLSIDSLELSRC